MLDESRDASTRGRWPLRTLPRVELPSACTIIQPERGPLQNRVSLPPIRKIDRFQLPAWEWTGQLNRTRLSSEPAPIHNGGEVIMASVLEPVRRPKRKVSARCPEPAGRCVLTIFGVTGDLTQRLLLPALY